MIFCIVIKIAILRVNMYITCQIGLKLKIGQTRLKSEKSNRFYKFDRVWSISSFNPQKLKKIIVSLSESLDTPLHSPHSPVSSFPVAQISNFQP